MIEMFVNNTPLVLPTDLKIRVEINSPAFESDVIPTSIVYYFNVPVVQNEPAFDYSNHVEVANKFREYDWKMRYEGFWIFTGKIIVTQINNEFRCAATIKQLPTNFGDKNITDINYDRVQLGSRTMQQYVEQTRAASDNIIAFPGIYAPNLYGEGESATNQNFEKIVNPINVTNENNNTKTVIPCFHALYIIQTMFKSQAYTVINPDDNPARKLILFNNYTLDAIPSESYAFSNLTGQTDLNLLPTDDPTNSIRENKYYASVPGEYEITIYAEGKITTHTEPQRRNATARANIIFTENYSLSGVDYKGISFVDIEYDPQNKDKIYTFVDTTFCHVFEPKEENWLYFELSIPVKGSGSLFRDCIITKGHIEIRRINSSIITNNYTKEINPANHIPAVTCSDFLLALKQFLGFTYLFDTTEKTLQIILARDILSAKTLDLTPQYIATAPDIEIKKPRSHEITYQGIEEFDLTGYTYAGQYNTLADIDTPPREKIIIKVKNVNSYYESKLIDNTLQWVRVADVYKKIWTNNNLKSETIELKLTPISMDEHNKTVYPYYPDQGVSPLYSPGTPKTEKLIAMLKSSPYDATTANMGYTGLVNMFSFDLAADDGVYNLYLKPWYDFIDTANTYTVNLRVNIEDVFRVLTLFNPQNTTPENQIRRVRLLNQNYIPQQFTFEFSHTNIICQAKLMKNDNN